MELESRKVQKLGYSSLGVSLPKAWAESNGILPGSVVNLSIEDDGTLRVRVGPFEEYPTAAEATIDADDWTGAETLTRLITGDYIVGCNTIKVRSRDELSPAQLQEIHEAVRGLTGLTIVNQGPRFVTIENFVEPTRFPIDGLLRRLHYLTSRMEKLALGVLAGEAVGRIEEVARMEVEVDRLYWLVVRQLLLAAQNRTVAAKIGVTEPRHLLGNRVASVTLENIGDLWEELATEIGPLLRSGGRSSHRGRRVDAGWIASGPGPTGLVVSTELANRLRLPRSRLRELRHEDDLRDVCEERVQSRFDVPLEVHPQSFGNGLRCNERQVPRDGV